MLTGAWIPRDAGRSPLLRVFADADTVRPGDRVRIGREVAVVRSILLPHPEHVDCTAVLEATQALNGRGPKPPKQARPLAAYRRAIVARINREHGAPRPST